MGRIPAIIAGGTQGKPFQTAKIKKRGKMHELY